MVASRSSRWHATGTWKVSIPFIAGQWSLLGGDRETPSKRFVSIPFIAGQWSLRPGASQATRESDRVSIPFIAGQWSLRTQQGPGSPPPCGCFNPLHCGAVVASQGGTTMSIVALMFQSPSLRGSGRFKSKPWLDSGPTRSFNPLHCGAVVASAVPTSGARRARRVSIPFIAGQWSLHDGTPRRMAGGKFQSPSLRGSGRFRARGGKPSVAPRRSFNPLHCGAVVASAGADHPLRRRSACFNPLHCGAVVAS